MMIEKKYNFQRIEPTNADWNLIESTYDSTVFHSRSWFDYLKKVRYQLFMAVVYSDEKKIGYFLGERIWRGTWIVAAPFDGIGTYTQGLAMLCHITEKERVVIYKELSSWIFANRMASYFQVDDWQLRQDSEEWDSEMVVRNEFIDNDVSIYEIRPTLHVFLNKTIEELWRGLHYKSCKYCVNKARKQGLEIRVIDRFEDIIDFIKIHYDQLKEVCYRKGMKPKSAQSEKRMLALCSSLFPDKVLMIEVVGKDENGEQQIMSSGIFCIDKGESCYWTGASYKRYQKYSPNELMVWEAMRILSERGAGDLNFCGMANYKLKFGTIYAYVPRIIFTKHKWIYRGKILAKKIYKATRHKFIMFNKNN